MLEMERKSGILIIEADAATARFFLRKGHIMRAEIDGSAPLSGATAVYDALGWKEGQFEFLIGDSVAPRKADMAIWEGHKIGREI